MKHEIDVPIKEWIETVLLKVEFPLRTVGHTPTVRQWVFPPTISVTRGSPKQRSDTNKAIVQLNDVLAGTKAHPLSVSDASDSVDIDIRFVPGLVIEYLFLELCGSVGNDSGIARPGVFDLRWNGNNELRKATIYINSELEDAEMRHVVLEELVQCFGFMNDSDLIRDSVFFESKFDTGDATVLSECDKALIRFSYNHLSPGDTRAEVEKQLVHWGQVPEFRDTAKTGSCAGVKPCFLFSGHPDPDVVDPSD